MTFLLLQTFAWMTAVFLLGAILGCLARRTFGARIAADDMMPAGAAIATAAPMAARTAAAVPAAMSAAVKGPMIEASRAPLPVTPAAPATVPTAAVTAAAPYTYPITTVGIPRGQPAPIQPQIQKIELTPAVAPAASTPVAPATVTIKQPAAPAAPVTPAPAASAAPMAAAATAVAGVAATVAAVRTAAYPITTIGIPPAYPAPAPASTPTAAALAAVHADTARFARALAGTQQAPGQPRPEPLRPELARAPAAAVPPAAAAAAAPSVPVAAPAPPVTATVQPSQPAPAARPITPAAGESKPVTAPPSTPAEQPFTPVAAPAAALSALAARATAAQAQTAAPAAQGDDLTRIRAIDTTMQARLKSVGITRFSEIAKWTPVDVARVGQSLGLIGRIEQENWIEQAQILSSGGETDYSRRRLRGEIPAVPDTAAPTPAAPATTATAAPSQPAAMPTMAQAAAGAAAAAAAAAASASRPSEPAMPAKLADAIRENTIKPGEPQPDVRTSRPDLAGLRSVRSEALRGDVTASETLRSGGSARPSGSYDDLKRIRGIGVLIEKKLNSLGVSTYEQVANWTNADIDRVSQILDFKGRIERESWVEQARILASGGQTEFSRRVDRGEA